mmetsp:Transcript_43727/g.141937  ORF Transcript_43727/g.141937 Transcript_43727/m.141937 type:complete len:268 (+) Transcript_43727:363-1166(+)
MRPPGRKDKPGRHWLVGLRGESGAHGSRLAPARDDEEGEPRGVDGGQSQRHAASRRLWRVVHVRDCAPRLTEHGMRREEGGGVAVRAHPQQHRVQPQRRGKLARGSRRRPASTRRHRRPTERCEKLLFVQLRRLRQRQVGGNTDRLLAAHTRRLEKAAAPLPEGGVWVRRGHMPLVCEEDAPARELVARGGGEELGRQQRRDRPSGESDHEHASLRDRSGRSLKQQRHGARGDLIRRRKDLARARAAACAVASPAGHARSRARRHGC